MVTIADVFGMAALDGRLYGVEFEVEYRSSSMMRHNLRCPPGWERVNDHSLRNGVELVSSPSTSFSASRAVLGIYRTWEDCTMRTSLRCGIHVHANVRDRTAAQLRSLCAAYALVEPLFALHCGPERENNVYCVPTYWLTESIGQFAQWLSAMEALEEPPSAFRQDALVPNFWSKYTSLNLGRITDLGTVEFRMCPTFENSEDTLRFLRSIYSLDRATMELTAEELADAIEAGDEVRLCRELVPSLAELHTDEAIDGALTSRDSTWTALRLCNTTGGVKWAQPVLTDYGESGARRAGQTGGVNVGIRVPGLQEALMRTMTDAVLRTETT